MGEGVSLSLPYLLGVSVPFPRENGVCVGSVPFSREQVYFSKSILQDFQAINDTVISVYGLHISFVGSAPYSRELVLFGEISLLVERELPKEQQRWLIRRSKAVASPGLQISDDVADSGTAASNAVFGGVACCFPAVVCIAGAVASDPQGYPPHDSDLSRSEVIKTAGASSVAAIRSFSGVTDSITDAGATASDLQVKAAFSSAPEPEDDSPAVAFFDAADSGPKQRTTVANNGPIADSDTINVATTIARTGGAVSDIGPIDDSGHYNSDLLGSAPLSLAPGRSSIGSRPEVSILGLGDNGGRYRMSTPENTRMGCVTVGLSVNASGELCFSGGINLPKTMLSVGSSGLLRCGSSILIIFGKSRSQLLDMSEFREAIDACAWVHYWLDVAVGSTHRADPQVTSMSIFVRGLGELVVPFFRAVMVKASVLDRPDPCRKEFLSQPVRFGHIADDALDAAVAVFDAAAAIITSSSRRGSVGARADVSGLQIPGFIGWIPIMASHIVDVASRVLDLPELRGSESPDLGGKGRLSVGPLFSGFELSLDLVLGGPRRQGCCSAGKESVSAEWTSGKATDFETLIRSVRPLSRMGLWCWISSRSKLFLGSTALGFVLVHTWYAIAAVHIFARDSAGQGRPLFIDRPVWLGHGRFRVVSTPSRDGSLDSSKQVLPNLAVFSDTIKRIDELFVIAVVQAQTC